MASRGRGRGSPPAGGAEFAPYHGLYPSNSASQRDTTRTSAHKSVVSSAKQNTSVYINGPFALALWKLRNPAPPKPTTTTTTPKPTNPPTDIYADMRLTDEEARTRVLEKIAEAWKRFPKPTFDAISATVDEYHFIIGEHIHNLVSAVPSYKRDAAKITGMLLEMDRPLLLAAIDDNDALLEHTEAALEILCRHMVPAARVATGNDDETPVDETRAFAEHSPLKNPRECLALWKSMESSSSSSSTSPPSISTDLATVRQQMEKCFIGERPSYNFATPDNTSWAMWREQPSIRSIAQVLAFNGQVKQRCVKLAETVIMVAGRDLTWVICIPPENPTGIPVPHAEHRFVDLADAAPTVQHKGLDDLFAAQPSTSNVRYQFRDIVPKQHTPPFFSSGLVDFYGPENETFEEAHLVCNTATYATLSGWKKVEAKGRETSTFLELHKLQKELATRGLKSDAFMLGDGTIHFRGQDAATTEVIWLALTKSMMNVPSLTQQKQTRVEKPRKTAVSEPETAESTIIIAATSDITPAIAAVLLPLIFGEETPSTSTTSNLNTPVTTTTTTSADNTATTTTQARYKVLSATRRTWRIKTTSDIAKKWRFANIGSHVTVYAENWNASWDAELRRELETSPSSPSSQVIIIPQSPHQQAATSV
jgi:hypothetical protein